MRYLVFSIYEGRPTLSAMFLLEESALEYGGKYRPEAVRIQDCSGLACHDMAERMARYFDSYEIGRWSLDNLPGVPLAEKAEVAA